MGVLLSCTVIVSNSFKKSRGNKETTQTREINESQPRFPEVASTNPAVGDAQSGLKDEHSASTPQQEEVGVPTGEVQKEVGVKAPVPVSTATAHLPPTGSNKPPLADARQDTPVKEGNKDKMASDEDYTAFLDKANQDPNEGVAKSQSKGKVELKAVDQGVKVPAVLTKATKDAFYVSDADEPFVPVCLKTKEKKLPDEKTFASLVNHPNPGEADVQILDIGEWDTQGQYKELVDATREASKGSDVRVYRVGREGSRVEYWVIGLEGGKLVGVKALAIES